MILRRRLPLPYLKRHQRHFAVHISDSQEFRSAIEKTIGAQSLPDLLIYVTHLTDLGAE